MRYLKLWELLSGVTMKEAIEKNIAWSEAKEKKIISSAREAVQEKMKTRTESE